MVNVSVERCTCAFTKHTFAAVYVMHNVLHVRQPCGKNGICTVGLSNYV